VRGRPAGANIIGMHARHELTRRILVPLAEPPAARSDAPRVRHFRLARVPPHTRRPPEADRFAHLRRGYD
jgi:hypothetical protein